MSEQKTEYMSGHDVSKEERLRTWPERSKGVLVGSLVTVTKWSTQVGHDGNLDLATILVVLKMNGDYDSERSFLVADQHGRTRWAYMVELLGTDPSRRAEKAEQRAVRYRTELDEFREKVAVTAQDLSEEYGWCEVVDTALKDLGLDEFLRGREVDITMTVKFRASNISKEMRDRLRNNSTEDDWVRGSWSVSVSGDEDGGETEEATVVSIEEAEFVS